MLRYSLRFCSTRSEPNRLAVTALDTSVERLKREKVKEKSDKKLTQTQKEIRKHFDHPNRKEALEYPPSILTKSRKKNQKDGMYLADKFGVETVFDAFTKNLPEDKLVYEINPGIGMLSKRLITETKNKLVLCEPNEFCYEKMKKLAETYPDRDVTVKNVNFINLWKMEFLDRFDYGNRVSSVFEGIKRAPFYHDTVFRAFACIGTSGFFKDLINSIVFQNSFMLPGRSEYYICVPPSVYLQLTCSPDIGYLFYRQSSIMFQILFEYEFITKINKKYFVPWMRTAHSARKDKILKDDDVCMYLIRIAPRKNIYKFVPMNHMSTLWFFIRQHLRSRSKPIIPTMERWIPGCGLRLIINAKPQINSNPLFPNEDIKSLPDYYAPCQSLTVNQYVDNIGVFTHFGKLTPMQILTIFDQFVNWPEYESSSFGDLLEKSLEKMFASPDENAHEIESDDEEEPANDDEEGKTI